MWVLSKKYIQEVTERSQPALCHTLLFHHIPADNYPESEAENDAIPTVIVAWYHKKLRIVNLIRSIEN